MARVEQEGIKLVTMDQGEVDLRNHAGVLDWFEKERPQLMFLAAAKVAGMEAKDSLRAEFIVDYNREISFNTSRPDGTSRKLLEVSLLQKLGWRVKT